MKLLKKALALFLSGAVAFGGVWNFPAENGADIIWAASRGASMENGLDYDAGSFSGVEFNGANVYEISPDDAALFQENIRNAASLEISITFRVQSAAKNYINLLEISDKSNNASSAGVPQSSIAVIASKEGTVFFEAGSNKTGTDWQTPVGVNIADGAFHTLEMSVSAGGMKCRIDGSAWKESSADGSKNTKKFMTAFFGGAAEGYTDWRGSVDSVAIGGLSPDSCFKNDAYMNLNGEISAVLVSGINSSEITGGGVAAGMFEAQSLDNTWLFGGGAETQGRFSEIGCVRNYIGQFEEYIRWVKRVDSTLLGLQRYVINVGKEGQDAVAFAAELDSYIAKTDPKAVSYLVGPEDYRKGGEGLEAFQEAIAEIIHTSLAMRENSGYVVIQLPHATKASKGADDAGQYAKAAKETALAIAAEGKNAERMAVVDHMKQTDTDGFKNKMLTADGLLNAKGHYEIAQQFTKTVCGDTSGFPAISDSWETEDLPIEYSDTAPEAAASGNTLEVTVPEDDRTVEWNYVLATDAGKIAGKAYGNPFAIERLPEGAEYELTVSAADGSVQFAAVEGRVTDGNEAKAVGAKGSLQEAIRNKTDQTEGSLTWLFMGDSITHAAAHTHGYDGIAQIFEKYLKEDLKRSDDIVINTAVSGATTVRTLENINERMTKYKPDIVSVMLGTNDSRELAAADYIANMKEIVDKIREASPDALIIFRSPVPAKNWGGSNRFPGEDGYIAALKKAAEEDGKIIFIDQYTEWSEKFAAYPYLYNAAYYYGDGNVHPGAAGQLEMTRWFIRECGLSRNAKIANLSFRFDSVKEESSLVPEVLASEEKDAVTVSKEDLNAAYTSGEIGDITVVLSDAWGRTYTKNSGLSENEVCVRLPENSRYTVKVTANIKGNQAKKVSFASEDIILSKETGTAADREAAENAAQLLDEILEFEGTNDYEAAVRDAEAAYDALTDVQKLYVPNEKCKILADAKQAMDKRAADDVIAKINAIGILENTEFCRRKTEAAKTAYQALTDNQKKLVSNAKQKLLAAAEGAMADYDAVDAVAGKIDAIGTVTNTPECRQKTAEARTAYNSLTASQKELLSKERTETLEAAESAIADYDAADEVAGKIDAIGTVTNTPECRQKIESARLSYNALTEKQKLLVPKEKLKVLTDAEASYAALGNAQGDLGAAVEKGEIYESGGLLFKALDVSKRTAEFAGVRKQKAKLVIPGSVQIGKERYKVVSVGDFACKNNKKATSAVIGKNVESIGKNAFAGCAKLKKATIKSTKLKKIGSKAFYNCKVLSFIQIKSKVLKSVGANALKGIHKKAVIRVPSVSLKTYKKKLAKKGQKKTVSVKS